MFLFPFKTIATRSLTLLAGLILVGCQSLDNGQEQADIGFSEHSAHAQKKGPRTVAREHEDIWQRIREGFALQDQIGLNPRIERQRLWFVSNPSFLERSSQRGSRYLHYVVERLQEHDMPMELALLPMIESAYNPYAYSRSHAAGLWQFIPSTGRYFNLPQNNMYDGRRDITASTRAALIYLERLNKMFDGDWLLAMAAYNAGEGTVGRAIERNRSLGLPTDYWNLPLPEETQNYVPKILALSQIVMSPNAYGVHMEAIANQPYFTKIPSTPGLDLARLADMIEMDKEEFDVLNPAFKRGVTVANGPQHLLIPVDKAEAIDLNNLALLKVSGPVSGAEYRVRPGDTLSRIAQQHKVSISELQQANRLRSHHLNAGQVLNIPGAQALAHTTSSRSQPVLSAARSNTNTQRYQVRPGDTLWKIASAHKVSAADLQRWNNLSGSHLSPGQSLHIQAASTQSLEADPTYYKVQTGDSLYQIAQRFRVSVQQLRGWNPHSSPSNLQPGQTITLYTP